MSTLYVVKIGGNIIDDEKKLSAFLKDFAAVKGQKILIHGGGKLATKLAEQMNIPQQMIDGRRITDAETLKIVTMVYAGYINKNIVAQLQANTCNAIGLSGADGNVVLAHKRNHPTIDYGLVGDVDAINTGLLKSILDQQIAVVMAPITHDKKGQLLNTNADTIAQEVATSLSALYDVQLIYSFEKSGVLLDANDDSTVINSISPSYYQQLKSEQKIFAGMIPKLDNAFAALTRGVKKVIIGKAEQLTDLITGKAEQALYMNKDNLHTLQQSAIELLKQLISTPSFSKEEDKTAEILRNFFDAYNVSQNSIKNNVYAWNKFFNDSKPTILLNSHHDTVKPNKNYTLDPFTPIEKDGKLFGLGSNDAGGPLVALIATFLYFNEREDLKYNLVFAASAEEEISGKDGIELVLPELGPIDCAIVGEPTQMQMAVAERGLMVLDCTAHGKAGHAARNEGENSIYKAIKDIEWFESYQFPKVSDLLGPVKMSVTVIETDNKQHNVVPAHTKFVVDTRVNELYTFEDILEVIQKNVQCEVVPRSTRLRSTSIAVDHPLIKSGIALAEDITGSPTTSDKALMPFQALKMGPGDSARSHTADEYIYINEVVEGIELYVRLLNGILYSLTSKYINYETVE